MVDEPIQSKSTKVIRFLIFPDFFFFFVKKDFQIKFSMFKILYSQIY